MRECCIDILYFFDLSYTTDLDLWNSLGSKKKKTIVSLNYTRPIYSFVVILEGQSLVVGQNKIQ